MTAAAVLSVAGLTKRYGANVVLRDVDLDIAPGEFVILIGGSGSGKTTLLRIAGGLERADRGSVALRGRPVDDPAARIFVPAERRGLGMVFQDYALWPHMTCLENVAAVLRGSGGRHAAQDLLDELGVGALGARRPSQLSGGQQQRVGLARALAVAPDLLLLDEPLSSLDVDVRERMRNRIRAIVRQHGTAALFVSHDPIDAWRLADRVAVLEQGGIVQVATPEAIYRRPATARVARFTDAIGGLAVRDYRNGGNACGFAWADGVQEATAPASLAAGDRIHAFIRPCGVRTGANGETARLVGHSFEDGRWRATWHVPTHDWTLCSLEDAHPPQETRLRFNREHVFLYSEKD